MAGKAPDAASAEQVQLVREFEAARGQHRHSGRLMAEAFKACCDGGLEFVGHYPNHKWPVEQGEWRPKAGTPVTRVELLPYA